jgi:hypothetical protein
MIHPVSGRALTLALLGALAVACGDSKATKAKVPAADDPADPPDTTTPTGDGVPSTNAPTAEMPGATSLVKRGGARLIGVTTDEQIVYLATGGTGAPGGPLPSLETIPVSGGTPTVLAQSFDPDESVVVVRGGAVGFWTETFGGETGTFNLWSKLGGLRPNLTDPNDSAVGVFAASEDGARVAFSVGMNSSETATNLAIADATNVGRTVDGFLDSGSLVNVAAGRGTSPTCAPQIRFAGRALIAAFCAGTSSVASAARLYYVPDGTNNELRLDNVGSEIGSIKPFWFSNRAGTKIFVVSSDGASTGRIVTPPVNGAIATSVRLEDDVASAGFISEDGNTVVYRTPFFGLRRAGTGANPAPQTLVPGIRTILAIAPNLSRVLVRTLDMNDDLRDIRSVDAVTLNQVPRDIVPTASARPIGFTGDANHILYLTDWSGDSGRLQSQASVGGENKVLAEAVSDVVLPEEGPGALAVFGFEPQLSIRYVNATTGRATEVMGASIPSINEGIKVMKKRLVWAESSPRSSPDPNDGAAARLLHLPSGCRPNFVGRGFIRPLRGRAGRVVSPARAPRAAG